MRAFVTLEGIALSADEDDSFNMYKATAPYARRKLLTPRTKGGRTLLKAALLLGVHVKIGDIDLNNLDRLHEYQIII